MNGITSNHMREVIDTVVIGAGHAGLALSCYLLRNGTEHVVLERGQVGERWRTERWDSLVFQFPNWSLQLPDYAYRGPDPDGYASKDEFDTCDFSWIKLPILDGNGDPIHERGVTKRTGLFFLGLRRTYSLGSALVAGVVNDAAYIADRLAASGASGA
jgi:hypothetical protein